MPQSNLVLYCTCIHRNFVSAESREALIQGLTRSGHTVVAVDDLCGLAARRDPILAAWAARPEIAIIACYPRAVRSLLAGAGAPLRQDDSVQILNPRSRPVQEILETIGVDSAGRSEASLDTLEWKGDWEPWFPVIDGDRCRNCKLCFNFCLFGVYSLDDQGRVRVSHPDHCKNNCPACARVCPSRAIIFPKLDQSPINGDEVNEITAASACNLDRLKEINVYDLLRQRGGRTERFSTAPRPESNLLEILHQKLDIPMDVLTALSPSDLARIQQKAALPREQNQHE